MYTLAALFRNFPLISAFLSWFLAQLIKFILIFAFDRDKINSRTFFSSGGMPSSHTSSMIALTTSLVLQEGFASPLVAVSGVMSFVVMYDAMGVRRSAGEQARTLNQLLAALADQKQIPFESTVREIFGHTPLQVAVGAVIGVIVPLVLHFAFGM